MWKENIEKKGKNWKRVGNKGKTWENMKNKERKHE